MVTVRPALLAVLLIALLGVSAAGHGLLPPLPPPDPDPLPPKTPEKIIRPPYSVPPGLDPTTPKEQIPGTITRPGAPRTPTAPAAPGPGQTPGARARTPGVSSSPSWTCWWFYNRSRYLPKHPVAELTSETTTAWGRRRRGVPWREEAIRALLRSLAAAAVEPCAGAALALGKAGEARAIPTLTTLLRDPKSNRVKRESAALSLGMIGGDVARDVLLETLRKGAEKARLRGLAAIALGLTGRLDNVPALVEAARDDHREVRSAALVALGLLDDPIARPVLTAAARGRRGDDDFRVRAAAIHAVGRGRDRETVPVLLEALKDDRAEIRRAAVLALGRVVGPDDREAHRTLIAVARDDRDPHVRSFTAIALGRTGSPRVLGTLRHLLDAPRMEERGFAAIGIALLGRAGEDEAFRRKLGSLLLPLLDAGGVAEDTEAAAAIGLGLLGDRRAIDAIVPMLDRAGRPASRGHAAVALGMLGAVEALPSLRRAILEDRNPWVQRELAVALGLLRDGESVNALAGLVRGGGSEWDRANAACALGRIATPESALVMVGLLTSPRSSDSARGRVAEGLGPLLDARPFPPLFAVAEDWDYGLELEVFRQVLHLL